MLGSGRRFGASRFALTLLALILMTATSAFGRDKTDVITLRNGDRITCEIKQLDRGKLTVSTTYMKTIDIEWRGIESVESQFGFEVETQSGLRYRGIIAGSDAGRTIRVGAEGAFESLPVSAVVRMVPVEDHFWDRIDLNLNLGYNFTSSNSTTQWTFASNTRYRQGSYEVHADFSSYLNAQEDVEATVRNVVSANVKRSLGRRWLVSYLGQAQQDTSLSLDLRSLFGAGVGRTVLQNDRFELQLLGGGAYSREWYAGEDPSNSAEALGGLSADVFVFGGREKDISIGWYVLPSLSHWGRVRMELSSNLRIEIVNDLFWNFELFDSYDSDPPRANIQRNSFGVGTSIGWKF